MAVQPLHAGRTHTATRVRKSAHAMVVTRETARHASKLDVVRVQQTPIVIQKPIDAPVTMVSEVMGPRNVRRPENVPNLLTVVQMPYATMVTVNVKTTTPEIPRQDANVQFVSIVIPAASTLQIRVTRTRLGWQKNVLKHVHFAVEVEPVEVEPVEVVFQHVNVQHLQTVERMPYVKPVHTNVNVKSTMVEMLKPDANEQSVSI